MTPRVLISDKMSPAAEEVFRKSGLIVEVRTGLGKEELAEIIGEYDGIAIRSATKITEKTLQNAGKLKVIGRAGIGVDNVDINAASAKGIIVMNTPFGNSITTAEHAIAMIFALARQLPQANASTHAGKWEKNAFMGVELANKTLGIIGCGNIGSIVADRAQGLKMKVAAYDPYLSGERAMELGITKYEVLEEFLEKVDFVSLHTPLTEKTRNILNAETLAKMKPGSFVVNCARGGLLDEEALLSALNAGHIAGAGLDVFSSEPATENILFGHPRVVCTPHLGASTTEAQENVAIQVAEQMSTYLTTGGVQNAINSPSITAEEAPILRPYIVLGEMLGSYAGQLNDAPIQKISIEYSGKAAGLNGKAIGAAVLTGIVRQYRPDANMVSSPIIARQDGLEVLEVRNEVPGDFESLITLRVYRQDGERTISGTIFSNKKPRIVAINDIVIDAAPCRYMLYVRNEDRPGYVGTLGQVLGEAGVNIATFHMGRKEKGAKAIILVALDSEVDQSTLDGILALDGTYKARRLVFNSLQIVS